VHEDHSTEPPKSDFESPLVPWYKQATAAKLVFMCILITAMFVLELWGGLESGSLALVSDAFHMLGDGMSLIIALMCFSLSKRRKTLTMSFGWERAEVLGGLINGVVLVAVCVFIVIEAINRFIDPPVIKQPLLVMGIGGISLAFNLAGMCLFHQGGHGHSHGGEHEHSHSGGHGHSHGGEQDMNVKAIFLHILGDALASVAVIASGSVVYATDWKYKYRVDPFVSVLISIIILWGTIPLIKRTSLVLLQATPAEYNIQQIKRDLLEVEGVTGVHHLHVWQLFKKKTIATLHVNIGNDTKFSEVIARVRTFLHLHGIHNSTIQPEPFLEGCEANCGVDCEPNLCCPAQMTGTTRLAEEKSEPRTRTRRSQEAAELPLMCIEETLEEGGVQKANENQATQRLATAV